MHDWCGPFGFRDLEHGFFRFYEAKCLVSIVAQFEFRGFRSRASSTFYSFRCKEFQILVLRVILLRMFSVIGEEFTGRLTLGSSELKANAC